MKLRGRGVRIVALWLFALGLGCGGSPEEATEMQADLARADPVDTPQGGTTAWVRRLGGLGPELAVHIAASPDGGTVLVTAIGESGQFGTTPTSFGLVRLRPDGTVAWSREFPTAPAEITWASAAVTGMGNVFLSLHASCGVGTSCPDFGGGQAAGSVLVKFGPSGTFLWQRAEDTVMNLGPVAVDATGSAAFPAVRGGSGPDAVARIFKYRWDGERLWDLPAPELDGTRAAQPTALAFDPLGNLVVGDGLAFASLDVAGRIRWTGRLAGSGVAGRIASIGTTAQGTVVVLAQHGPGTVSWAGTSSPVTGDGASAVFLAVAESYGAPRFGRVLASTGWNALGAAVDPAGRVAVLVSGGPAPCEDRLERWNLAGARLWTRRLATCNGAGSVLWSGVAVDPLSHHVRAAGGLWGTVNLGTGPVTSRGRADDLVVDLLP